MKCGKDVRISPLALIAHPELVIIGDHVAIDAFVVITTAMELGNYIHIAPFCSVIGGAESKLVMEGFSSLAAGCRIVCGSEDYTGEGLVGATIPKRHRSLKQSIVIIKRFATLGTNVVVHPGITVGVGTAVGSCSLVTKDLDSWGIYLGIPARRMRDRRQDQILRYADELMERGKESA